MDQGPNLIHLDRFFAERTLHYAGLKGETDLADILAHVMAASRQGNLCTPLSTFKTATQKLLQEQEKLASFVRIDRGNVYLEKNWTIERLLEKEIQRLSARQSPVTVHSKLPLNEEQARAVEICLKNRLSLLTGGPGTGKTFTAAAIVETFDPKGDQRILLAAPTGKAAEHLGQSIYKACGRQLPSATIHKWLELGGTPPWPNEEEYLEADLLLVDECSMIDAQLFATLLKAIPERCCTILMGDPNQLSPVGIGSIFADLVRSTNLPIGKAQLTKSMRVENQEILSIAHEVLNARIPKQSIVAWPDSESEFYNYLTHSLQLFIGESTEKKPNPEDILQRLSQCKLLNCLRQGPFGADAINQFFVEKVRQNAKMNQWWWMPIMITSNDERTGLSNGEMGIYMQKQGDRAGGMAYFSKKNKEIPLMVLPSYEVAFCSSVHKSQGSEFDEVIVIVPVGSESFGREMLYTAITRARQKVSLLAHEDVLAAMLGKSLIKHSGIL